MLQFQTRLWRKGQRPEYIVYIIYLLICGLFNDALISADYDVEWLDGSEKWIWKVVEGNGRSVT
jgi:hypothetical protein